MTTNIPQIKVGILVSYDYLYLKEALPRIYNEADSITLAIDKDGKTWSGNNIHIPDSFFVWLKEYDKDNKIKIYQDSFHVPGLSPLDSDTRERNMLGQFMGKGGWHIQLDSDEYFLDFKDFCDFLRKLDIDKDTLIYAQWITLFKQNGNDYFLINAEETFPLATSNPVYKAIRVSESQNPMYTGFKVIHQSWARGEDEIKLKLNNWGHTNDFDVDSYFEFWKMINKQTYRYVRSFHPLDSWLWPSLHYFEAKNIEELINKVKNYLHDEELRKIQANKIKLKDFIPLALYKIKAKLLK